MKLVRLVFVLWLVIPLLSLAQSSENEEGVRRAVLNYVEGFYEGDSTKIAMGVFSEVNKRGFYIPSHSDSGEYMVSPMSFEEMFDYVRNVRRRKNYAPASAPKEIEIYDVMDQTASVKLTAFWGSDYMLLAKRDGKWKIWQVLWQTPPPKGH
ncbi:MAG: nuclear transport factor 2 family protein [Bacteroidetes bacterium]|nr:nuclear transport factor 2 family protein [Bacteroidota bacterium]